jgi:DNA/RNA-binding domain of Phe-tRNA-synthetase-like protein
VSDGEPRVGEGSCEREVAEELPGLRLLVAQARHTRRQALSAASPSDVCARLHELSNRFRGARTVGVRREPVPGAYRQFYRQIGLDPDLTRPPLEAALVERMLSGGFAPAALLADALLIALLDTGVPVWALDADTVAGPLGIRTSKQGEPLGRSADAPALPAGRLVIADDSAALAVLFGALAPGHEAGARTRLLTLFAVQVAGVPTLHVQEALHVCRGVLEQSPARS